MILNALGIPSTEGIYLLPFPTTGFRTKSVYPHLRFRLDDKYRCLGAVIAFILIQWWKYGEMLVPSGRLNHMINYLENIVAKGLDAFEITGNVRKGWRLHG